MTACINHEREMFAFTILSLRCFPASQGERRFDCDVTKGGVYCSCTTLKEALISELIHPSKVCTASTA